MKPRITLGKRALLVVVIMIPWLTLSVALAGAPAEAKSAAKADVVLYNGKVVTMEPGNPQGAAIAIHRHKIIAIGSSDSVMRTARRDTVKIDLGGRTVAPGFVDAHSHLFNEAAQHGMTLEQAQSLALQNGITTLGDLYVPPEFIPEMRAFRNEGKLLSHQPVPGV